VCDPEHPESTGFVAEAVPERTCILDGKVHVFGIDDVSFKPGDAGLQVASLAACCLH
jgi:hypothetical protein